MFKTFPGRKLLLDVKDVGDDSVANAEDLEVMDIETWDDFEMAYWWLKKNPNHYQSLAIDTMSQLQALALRKVMVDKGKNPDRAGDFGAMTMKDWGAVSGLMKTWIINVRDLPMETCFIAQDRVFNASGEEDETQGLDPEVGPALSPSVARHLNAAVHFVANTFIRQRSVRVKLKNPPKGKPPFRDEVRTEFCARIGPNPIYITKVRKPKEVILPNSGVVVNPTYDEMMAIIRGETSS